MEEAAYEGTKDRDKVIELQKVRITELELMSQMNPNTSSMDEAMQTEIATLRSQVDYWQSQATRAATVSPTILDQFGETKMKLDGALGELAASRAQSEHSDDAHTPCNTTDH